MTIDHEAPAHDPRPHAEVLRRAVAEMASKDAISLVMRKVSVSVDLSIDGWRVKIDVAPAEAGQE